MHMQLFYRFLLLSCLLDATIGMQLLGANRCTWGPSWWCVNETTASDCNATQHCIENVWKTPMKKQQSKEMETILKNPIGLLPVGVIPQSESRVSLTQDACDTCKDRVLEIKILIKDNATSEGFEKLITNECIKWFNNEDYCHEIVSHASDAVFSIIKRSSPEQVCHNLGDCDSSLQQVTSEVECDLCRLVLEYVVHELSENLTEEKIKYDLIFFCQYLGELKNICKNFINDNLQDMIEFILENESPEKFCTQIKFCNNSRQFALSPLPKQTTSTLLANLLDDYTESYSENKSSVSTTSTEVSSSTKYCVECKFIISLIKQAISKSSEDDIEKNLDTLCDLVGEDQYEKCKELLDSFISKLYEILSGDMSVTELCEELNACSSQQVTLQRTYLHLWEQLQQSPSTDCVLCTWISQSIHPQLIHFYSHESLKNRLSSKCSQLPSHNQASCEEFVEKNNFISTLKSSSDSPVCQTMDICEVKSRSPSGFSLFI